jgi:hypothetical protein
VGDKEGVSDRPLAREFKGRGGHRVEGRRESEGEWVGTLMREERRRKWVRRQVSCSPGEKKKKNRKNQVREKRRHNGEETEETGREIEGERREWVVMRVSAKREREIGECVAQKIKETGQATEGKEKERERGKKMVWDLL